MAVQSLERVSEVLVWEQMMGHWAICCWHQKSRRDSGTESGLMRYWSWAEARVRRVVVVVRRVVFIVAVGIVVVVVGGDVLVLETV